MVFEARLAWDMCRDNVSCDCLLVTSFLLLEDIYDMGIRLTGTVR